MFFICQRSFSSNNKKVREKQTQCCKDTVKIIIRIFVITTKRTLPNKKHSLKNLAYDVNDLKKIHR